MSQGKNRQPAAKPTEKERALGKRQIIRGLIIGAIVGLIMFAITGEWLYSLVGVGIGLISGLVIQPSKVKDDQDGKNGKGAQRRR
ncbi:hypothetical protein F8O06_01050 [Pseudoclavibacter sp. CFCC 14310]|uniref:hypothetical protein n=1 Tax=Pseudoclavibacter sp. CFCC 14310 TaxID=2615180 RepID=UPI001301518F|nr:hypothetical protein [Pseudoclavibacter sp. CFCC 14310]KAB1647199.1 hypothetical protein F8O06_01050 [Pseudoclavibacter sp. CFCC 14310]